MSSSTRVTVTKGADKGGEAHLEQHHSEKGSSVSSALSTLYDELMSYRTVKVCHKIPS